MLSVKLAAAALSVIVPDEPLTLPTCCAKPFRSNVPPAIDNAVVLVNAFAIPTLMVPELMVVAPVNELAPVNVNVLDPPMVKPRLPVNVPAYVSGLLSSVVKVGVPELLVIMPPALPLVLPTVCAKPAKL